MLQKHAHIQAIFFFIFYRAWTKYYDPWAKVFPGHHQTRVYHQSLSFSLNPLNPATACNFRQRWSKLPEPSSKVKDLNLWRGQKEGHYTYREIYVGDYYDQTTFVKKHALPCMIT